MFVFLTEKKSSTFRHQHLPTRQSMKPHARESGASAVQPGRKPADKDDCSTKELITGPCMQSVSACGVNLSHPLADASSLTERRLRPQAWAYQVTPATSVGHGTRLLTQKPGQERELQPADTSHIATKELGAGSCVHATSISAGSSAVILSSLTGRRVSLQPQASPTASQASTRRRASCGSTSLPLSNSTPHFASLSQPQAKTHRKRHDLPAAKSPEDVLVMPWSSSTRYFADLVRRRQIQVAADCAAARTPVIVPRPLHTGNCQASPRARHASPTDMLPHTTTRRGSLVSSHTFTVSTPQVSSKERRGPITGSLAPSSVSTEGKLLESSRGVRYLDHPCRRRQVQCNRAVFQSFVILGALVMATTAFFALLLQL